MSLNVVYRGPTPTPAKETAFFSSFGGGPMKSQTEAYTDRFFVDDLQRRLKWLRFELSPGFRGPGHFMGTSGQIYEGSDNNALSRASQARRLHLVSRSSAPTRRTTRSRTTHTVTFPGIESWRGEVNKHRSAVPGDPSTDGHLALKVLYQGSSDPGESDDDTDTAAFVLPKPPQGIPQGVHSGILEPAGPESRHLDLSSLASLFKGAKEGLHVGSAKDKAVGLAKKLQRAALPIFRNSTTQAKKSTSPKLGLTTVASPRRSPVDGSDRRPALSGASGVTGRLPITTVTGPPQTTPRYPGGHGDGVEFLRPISPLPALADISAFLPLPSSTTGDRELAPTASTSVSYAMSQDSLSIASGLEAENPSATTVTRRARRGSAVSSGIAA